MVRTGSLILFGKGFVFSKNPSSGITISSSVKFGGEILKDSKLVEYQIDMKKIIKRGVIVGVGDGVVKVDGKEIYTAEGLKVGLIK